MPNASINFYLIRENLVLRTRSERIGHGARLRVWSIEQGHGVLSNMCTVISFSSCCLLLANTGPVPFPWGGSKPGPQDQDALF